MSKHFATNSMTAARGSAALAPLDDLPWFSPAPLAASPAGHGAGTLIGGRTSGLRHIALAALVAALVGGTWFVAGGSAPQADRAAGALAAPAQVIAAAPAAVASPLADNAMISAGEDASTGAVPGLSGAPQVQPQPRSAVLAAPVRAKAAAGAQVRSSAAVPAAKPTLAVEPVLATSAAGAPAPLSSPASESPVTATTQRQFRSAISQAKDAARDVVRLGERRRPGRDASAEEQTGYRLRQQNAQAARSYLAYLDTLARSMKGTSSESVAQQSLAKARQTLGYLAKMEADSQASLR